MQISGITLECGRYKAKEKETSIRMSLLWVLNTIDVYFSAEKINILYVWYHKNRASPRTVDMIPQKITFYKRSINTCFSVLRLYLEFQYLRIQISIVFVCWANGTDLCGV